MNFNIMKLLFLFCVVEQVRSCDDYLKCLGDFVHNFFSDANSTEVGRTSDNVTELIDIDDLGNETVSFLDVSQIGKTLTEALSDVANLIKNEIKAFNIDKEIDIHKELENKTEIHAKVFSLSKKDNNTHDNNNNATGIKIPKIIENNLTQFNEELSALKIELENNLKAEIEAFISQVLDNDTFDWVEVTENDLYDQELFTTTEISTTDNQSTTDINKNLDITTEEDIKTTEAIITSTTKPVIYTTKHPTVFMKSSTYKSEKESTKPILVKDKNKNVISVTTATKSPIYTTKHPTTFMKRKEFETKSKTKKAPSTHNDHKDQSTGKSQNNNATLIIPLLNTKTSTKGFIKNTELYTTVAEDITTSSAKPKETISTSTSQASTVAKTEITSPKPTEKPKLPQIEAQTKSLIDYKLIENYKLNEISRNDDSYYDIPEDNSTDYPEIDYADIYKDTTNEPVDYVSTQAPASLDVGGADNLEEAFNNDGIQSLEEGINSSTEALTVLPWLAAIFVKNGSDNQFNYVCDGALLSESTVLTAATCLFRSNATTDSDDVIIFLGKRSLQIASDMETIHKVKSITLHANFTLNKESAVNDLATLQLENPAVFSDSIAPACLAEGEVGGVFTTAWAPDLSPIELVDANKTCATVTDGVFCAAYGNQVTYCPSYGSVLYGQRNTTGEPTCIYGIRTTVGPRTAFCFERTLTYTSLGKHKDLLNQVK